MGGCSTIDCWLQEHVPEQCRNRARWHRPTVAAACIHVAQTLFGMGLQPQTAPSDPYRRLAYALGGLFFGAYLPSCAALGCADLRVAVLTARLQDEPHVPALLPDE
jgi:hypothetical protein